MGLAAVGVLRKVIGGEHLTEKERSVLQSSEYPADEVAAFLIKNRLSKISTDCGVVKFEMGYTIGEK